jgi:D-alanine-D-alanine ligase
MAMDKINVALIFGGRSAEHEVSILSARSVFESTPRERFDVLPMCVARNGMFMGPEASLAVLTTPGTSTDEGDPLFDFARWLKQEHVAIAFPLIHGTTGEDGVLQGYLDFLELPYVGAGVTASAVGMDKALMKLAFSHAKLPVVDFVAISESDWKNEREKVIRAANNSLRLPYFVKPANAGSSVGVSKVKTDEALVAAVDHAFRFDEKVLVERGIDPREIEVSVLGNDAPEASLPGEVVPGAEFYDYNDKYVDNRSTLTIPAKLSDDRISEIRDLAVRAFRAIGAHGYARVDFFVEKGTNKIYVNEINTIPGFTRISMYPKLWEATELKYARLIEKLIDLGLERGAARKRRFASMMSFFDDAKKLT